MNADPVMNKHIGSTLDSLLVELNEAGEVARLTDFKGIEQAVREFMRKGSFLDPETMRGPAAWREFREIRKLVAVRDGSLLEPAIDSELERFWRWVDARFAAVCSRVDKFQSEISKDLEADKVKLQTLADAWSAVDADGLSRKSDDDG
jgi:hypothetical protein